ncbi:hypothetical protein BKE38_25625 [Pseudoroseomonas deserti]|uniref:Anti-sigma factor NepR domain-containing protein n=1 Tax=Teichococcus deserti TaxID=1817963 RepID=A0A1V2GVP7_9PROT|nr:NepR family anti-sigma factor [Pseudoroseomonas deserti]ONG46205.1 hypothetical protein BKE38_25625 [Pseudoroseomonas deserti]
MDDRADKRMLAEPAVEASRPGSRHARPGAPDAAFDLWLQRGLHAMYDGVAKEPIPDELLRLIEQDRSGGATQPPSPDQPSGGKPRSGG